VSKKERLVEMATSTSRFVSTLELVSGLFVAAKQAQPDECRADQHERSEFGHDLVSVDLNLVAGY
jgi:hypothetical protein